jgi:DNA-binding NarL/FixJ family response regulator
MVLDRWTGRRRVHPAYVLVDSRARCPDRPWTYVLRWVVRAKRRPIRVLLACAYPATRAGLRSALSDERFELVAELADAPAAIDAARLECPDICVLDADMPSNAIEATARILRDSPETAVVLLAATQADDDMLEAVRAGAAGYLFKDMDPERLRFALIGVMEGEAALPRRLVARLMQEFRLRERGRQVPTIGGVRLTERERDVLELLGEGASTREVAAALSIADVTVRRHVSAAVAKLGVADRAAAIAVVRAARVG